MAAPKDLLEFHNRLIDDAVKFGFNESDQRGQLRDCIMDKSAVRAPKTDESNYWFGFIREGEPTSKAYEGLSFVIFPEFTGAHCVVAIGIGSSTTADGNYGGGSLGQDMDLAMKLSFARTFRSLTKKGTSDAQFFFKLNFTETVNPTPGLEKALYGYGPEMSNTVAVYDHKDKGGLLPACILVDYTNDDGYDLIVSWLAQYAKWRNWYCFKNGSFRKGPKDAIKDAIEKCKQDKEVLEPKDVLAILMEKRFIILQGAPGCGKTWTANEVSKDPVFCNTTKFIQFHADTSYSDFIYGIKPILNGENVAYTYEKGALLKILDDALENPNKKYLLIIDEINRANLASVLGPVFYLFEQNATDRDRTHTLTLGFNEKNDPLEYDHIPENLYVIGTMNTADKSLAVVDFALRRRFAWLTLQPHTISVPGFYFDSYLFNKVDELFMEYATDDELSLQPGQSYFLYPEGESSISDAYIEACRKDVIKYKLMPLIKEYFSEGYILSAKDSFAQLFYSVGEVVMYE